MSGNKQKQNETAVSDSSLPLGLSVVATGLAAVALVNNKDKNKGEISGNANITGNATIGGNASVGGSLTVTGATNSTGTSTFANVDINGGSIDGTAIGANTASTGAFTTASTTGQATLATVDINGGSIDGTAIGANTASTGAFTTASTTGQATLATVDINGGAIDGTAIGANAAAAGAFTTITASTSLDVTGAGGIILQNDETITNVTDGQVIINGATLKVGPSDANATIASNGAHNLILQTGATTTGSITIADGANEDITIAPNGTGNVILDGLVQLSKQDLNAAGAIPLTTSVGEITTAGDNIALALANGEPGQVMILTMVVDGGGNAVVTPATFHDGATITFDAIGETVMLMYATTIGWTVISNNDATIAG